MLIAKLKQIIKGTVLEIKTKNKETFEHNSKIRTQQASLVPE